MGTASDNRTAERLIARLLEDPERFSEEGRSYELLQHFFDGYQLEALQELLRDQDPCIGREALFIACELGAQAAPLLDDVIPYFTRNSRSDVYDAMEIVASATASSREELFAYVLIQLNSPDPVLRTLAMRLMCRASTTQLARMIEPLAKLTSPNVTERFRLGVHMLTTEISENEARKGLSSGERIIRGCAAVAVLRGAERGVLSKDLLDNSTDPDIQVLLSGKPDTRPRPESVE